LIAIPINSSTSSSYHHCNGHHLSSPFPLFLRPPSSSLLPSGSFMTYFMIWYQVERPKLSLKNLNGISEEDFPTVDVFIPVYNEPLQVRKEEEEEE